GPKGAGKPTLFNYTNGVSEPEVGRIRFRGIDITRQPPYRIARHGLSRTHQIVQPLTSMTVLENCTVGACFGRENLPLARAREVARGGGCCRWSRRPAGHPSIAADHRR